MDTQFPVKTFIYMKEAKIEILRKKKKTIYEYIYVYIKVRKNKCFNQRNIPLLVLKKHFSCTF